MIVTALNNIFDILQGFVNAFLDNSQGGLLNISSQIV